MGILEIMTVKNDDTTPIEIQDHRGLHFTSIDDVFVDKYARLVKSLAAAVYMVLCRHSGVDRACWPSLELLADKVGTTTRSVRRGMRVLESYRIIKIQRPTGRRNIYHLLEKGKWRLDKVLYRRCSRKSMKCEPGEVKVTWEGERMRSLSEKAR